MLLSGITGFVWADDFYYYDKQQHYSIENIKNAEFLPFDQTINAGFNNGVYWLKLGNQSNGNRIIQISNNHIDQVVAYENSEIIESLSNHRFVTYEIESGTQPIYFKITANKEAYIPIKSYTSQEYNKHEHWQTLLIGMFYGFALMVLIVNLFYYFNFQDRSFLLYSMFLMCLGITFAHRDGFIQIFGITNEFAYYSESFMHTLTGLVGVIFATDYLQLKANYPKFIYSLYFVVVIALIFDVLFLMNNKYTFFVLSDIFVYYIFISCWLVSLLLFNKYSYAVYFCIAYSLMVFLVFAYFISPAFALIDLKVNENILKISSYFEMLIITYAVVLRMRVLQDENIYMHEEILQYINEIKSLSTELLNTQNNQPNHFEQFAFNKRELEILDLISQETNNKVIAHQLSISVNTVKYHVKKIYKKLEVKNRKEIRLAIKTS